MKKFKTLLKLQCLGFTIIELMISTGIMAIALTAVMHFTIQSSLSFRYTRALSSHNDLISEIKLAIDTERSCTANFRNFIAPALNADNKTPTTISNYDNDGNKLRTVATVGKPFDQFIDVTGIMIRTKALLASDQRLLYLVVYSDKSGNVLGPRSNFAEIPFFATVDASSRIVSCYGNYQLDGQADLEKKICDLQSGGLMIYDPVTQKCINAVTCYPGTQYTAKCPSKSHAVKCTASGYIDAEGPKIERTYQGGETVMRGPPDYIFNISSDGTTCTCAYATEITVTADTHCNACCVED